MEKTLLYVEGHPHLLLDCCLPVSYREIPEVRSFVKQLQSTACELAQTMGDIRDAAERGFSVCGEGLGVAQQYKDFTSEEEIVGHADQMREVLQKGRQTTQTSLEKLEALHNKLSEASVALCLQYPTMLITYSQLSVSPAENALKACKKTTQGLIRSVEYGEIMALTTEGVAKTCGNAQSSNMVELGALLLLAPTTSIVAYQTAKSVQEKNKGKYDM